MYKVRKMVYRFMVAMDVDWDDIHRDPLATFGFGLDMEGKVFSPLIIALIILFWRTIYRHMMRVENENIRFHAPTVCSDLARAYMSCILNYQLERRDFYLSRRNTPRQEVLPITAVNQVSGWGELDRYTGRLDINSNLINLFTEHKVWNDFNA